MVAPELIGIQRFKKIELFLERTLSDIKSKLDEQLGRQQETPTILYILRPILVVGTFSVIAWSLETQQYLITAIALLLVYLFLVFLAFVAVRLGDFIVDIVVALATFGLASPKPLSAWETIRKYHILLLTWYPMKAILLAIVLMIIEPVLLLTNAIVSVVIHRLEGEERLRSIVVGTGILCFILGNLLQLLATF